MHTSAGALVFVSEPARVPLDDKLKEFLFYFIFWLERCEGDNKNGQFFIFLFFGFLFFS